MHPSPSDTGGYALTVALKGNTPADPENHTTPDANSKSSMLGLDSTQGITLDELH